MSRYDDVQHVIKEGIYVLFKGREAVYVGQSHNLYYRIGQHVQEGIKDFDSFAIYETQELDKMESFLITAFSPKYNVAHGNSIGWVEIIPADSTICPELKAGLNPPEVDETADYITIKEIAEDLNAYQKYVRDAISMHRNIIPRWRTRCGDWAIDLAWYEENKDEVRKWVLDED